MTTVYPWC